jgi:hypothetical protein
MELEEKLECMQWSYIGVEEHLESFQDEGIVVKMASMT